MMLNVRWDMVCLSTPEGSGSIRCDTSIVPENAAVSENHRRPQGDMLRLHFNKNCSGVRLMRSYKSRLAEFIPCATFAGVLAFALGSTYAPILGRSQTLPPAQPLKLPELKYQKFTLPNGLVVLTHEPHRLPLP